ncbi:hypothetical protein ABH942_002081 [Flavobacterium sp. 28YEA47A]|uniref:XAC2610-related protein n=1 Tax=Flavobacterium sp. 28YEA47A TaxID=3156276 RepID=UPI003513B574
MAPIKYLILFFFLISCTKKYDENAIIKTNEVISKKDTTELESDFKNKVNDSVYVIKNENRESFVNLFYSKDQNKYVFFDSIIIQNKSDKTIQKIKLKNESFLSDWETEYCLSVDKDINFDGFDDISLINYKGLYNSSHSYWVYKKNFKKYKHIKSLDSIYNVGFDKNKKEVYSEWRVALQEFHSETYFWKNDQIILKEENIRFSTLDSLNPEVEYHRKLINGKYIESGVKYY